MARKRSLTLAEYQAARREAPDFEDDEDAAIPSRILIVEPPPRAGLSDALGANREVGVSGIGRMILRAAGYCCVFVFYGFIFGFAVIAASLISPGHDLPTWVFFLGVNVWGLGGVYIQYRINRHRRLKASGISRRR